MPYADDLPRRSLCGCDQFVQAVESEENLPALTQDQTKALWAQTSFLNAQVPAATRMMIAPIMQLMESAEGAISPAIGAAVKEFMSLMISQVTDIRSALTKDENKFAHLVAHTDEIVEAMRGVAQLKDRLDSIYATQERILEAVATLFAKVDMDKKQEATNVIEAAHVFASKSAPLWNEPIVTEGERADES